MVLSESYPEPVLVLIGVDELHRVLEVVLVESMVLNVPGAPPSLEGLPEPLHIVPECDAIPVQCLENVRQYVHWHGVNEISCTHFVVNYLIPLNLKKFDGFLL